MNITTLLSAALAAVLCSPDFSDEAETLTPFAPDESSCSVQTADGATAVNPVALWNACNQTLKRKDQLGEKLIELHKDFEDAMDNGDTASAAAIADQIRDAEDELAELAPYIKLCKNLITRLRPGTAY